MTSITIDDGLYLFLREIKNFYNKYLDNSKTNSPIKSISEVLTILLTNPTNLTTIMGSDELARLIQKYDLFPEQHWQRFNLTNTDESGLATSISVAAQFENRSKTDTKIA